MMLKDVEKILCDKWDLYYKSDSLKCIVPLGNYDTPRDTRWILEDSLVCLGHIISADGGVREDWNQSKRCMWAVFWGNI